MYNIQVKVKLPELLREFDGFEWDEANTVKNWIKHKVRPTEVEQAFFNTPRVIAPDYNHSQREPRYLCLGITNAGRQLSVVLTPRGRKIRAISFRDQSRRERRIYEVYTQKAA
jgi:uncharacterized protein